jgi:hypothetical protein
MSMPGRVISHDWMQLMVGAGTYILADLFEGDDIAKQTILLDLVALFRELMDAVSPYDDEHDELSDKLDKLKVKTIEVMCRAEVVLPDMCMAILWHALLHIPDFIYRWNSVRNYWCFFGERYFFSTKSGLCSLHTFPRQLLYSITLGVSASGSGTFTIATWPRKTSRQPMSDPESSALSQRQCSQSCTHSLRSMASPCLQTA